MKTTKTILLAMTVAVGGGVSVSTAYGDSAKDDRLEERAAVRLSKDARFKDGAVRVDVDDGVATLKGKVASEAEKVRAEKMVRAQGVRRVDNQLEVDVDRAKDRIEDRAEAAKDRVDARAEAAKERIEQNADRAKDRLDDKAAGVRMDTERRRTSERALDRDGDGFVDGNLRINKDGHYVDSDGKVIVDRDGKAIVVVERRATSDRALDRDGDGYVDADIRIDRDGRYVDRDGKVIVVERRTTTTTTTGNKPAKTEAGAELSDTWITTKVKASFVGEDALKGSDISVDTNRDGVVTLTGTVPNEAARARAMTIARTTKGVVRVVDAMKLAADNK